MTFPAPGTNYTFDDDGVFQSGTIAIDRGYTPPGGEQFGMITQLSNRGVRTRAVTNDYGANVKWNATDRLSINLDGQYVKSTNRQTDFSVYGSTFANVDLDTTGSIPQVEFVRPSGTGSNAAYFADPANGYYRAAMDHFEDNDGREYAFRGDVSYDFGDDSFLKQAKVGARYADRDQTVRYSLYNWGVLSEVWDGSGPVHFNETPASGYGLYSFADVFRGDGPTGTNANYINGNPATQYDAIAAQAQAINALWRAKGANSGGWTPTGQRAGVGAGHQFPAEAKSTRTTKSPRLPMPGSISAPMAPICSAGFACRAMSACVSSRRWIAPTASSPSRRRTRSSAVPSRRRCSAHNRHRPALSASSLRSSRRTCSPSRTARRSIRIRVTSSITGCRASI